MHGPLLQAKKLDPHFAFSPQFFSSDPSPQSSSSSHLKRFWMQRPLPQVNSSERHVLLPHSNSSDPSRQSWSPSHMNSRCIHCSPFLHINIKEEHRPRHWDVDSSLPSAQSFSRSQTHLRGMHFPLPQRNCSWLQVDSNPTTLEAWCGTNPAMSSRKEQPRMRHIGPMLVLWRLYCTLHGSVIMFLPKCSAELLN